MKLLGLDFGTERIGYAIGDTDTGMAFGRDVFRNDHRVFDIVRQICVQESVERVILGLPKSSDGLPDSMEQIVRDFGLRLHKETDVPVEFQDERMTSKISRNVLRKQDITSRDYKGKVDVLAAQAILQQWMDKNTDNI